MRARLVELTWHTAFSALPFLHAAFEGDARGADLACEVFLSNHVARRASQAQGRALLLAAEATLEAPELGALRASLPHAHLPVAFGAAFRHAGLAREETRQAFLFGVLRSATSALVRLGVLGPLRAQAVLRGLHGPLADALAETHALGPADAASTSPWLETAQSAHDRLYSRLFQS